MRKNTWLILLASLAFAGCQDNSTSEQASPPVATEHSAQSVAPAQSEMASSETPSSAPANPSEAAAQPAAESDPLKAAATDTVAVTKPEKSSMASTVQQSMAQAKADTAAAVAGLAGESKTAASAATAGATQHKAAAVSQAKKASTPVAASPASATKAAVSDKPAAAAVAMASLSAGDAVKGEKLAKKCKACHNFTAKKKVGPGLKGIFGRKAGAMPDMKYGAALAAGGWVWDEKNLAAWVCNSKKAVKSLSGDASAKTKMGPQRICDATKQADLIAYLKTL